MQIFSRSIRRNRSRTSAICATPLGAKFLPILTEKCATIPPNITGASKLTADWLRVRAARARAGRPLPGYRLRPSESREAPLDGGPGPPAAPLLKIGVCFETADACEPGAEQALNGAASRHNFRSNEFTLLPRFASVGLLQTAPVHL